MKKYFIIMLVVLVGSFCLQAQDNTVLKGKVTDMKKNPLEGVKITIVNPESGISFNITTNKKGKFSKVGIQAGNYMATFESDGYVTYKQRVPVVFNKRVLLNVQIEKIVKQVSKDKNFEKGYKAFLKKDYKTAIILYKKSLEEFPNNKDVLYNLGLCYLNSKEYKLAVENLTKVVLLDKDFSNLYYALGNAYSELKDSKNAIINYEIASKKQSKNASLIYYLSMEYYNKSQFKSAIINLKQVLELKPEFVDARYNLAMCYLSLSKIKEAKLELEEALTHAKDKKKIDKINTLLKDLKNIK